MKAKSRLETHAEQLEEWFAAEDVTEQEAQARLAKLGCRVSLTQLRQWRERRESRRLQEELLEQIAQGAKHCAELEKEFGQSPPPGIETLLKVYRVLVLKVSNEANGRPELLRLAAGLMRPVLEWAKMDEQRKERELAEQKRRDQGAGEGGLRPETLERIEREINLF
jgi:hypothetical protein